VAKTLEQTVSNWQAGAGAAQQRFVDGVQGTQVDVVGKAIAAQPALVAGFNQAVSSGFWAARLRAVGTAGWKDRTVAKAANYGVGIQAGTPNYNQAMQVWLPRIQSVAAQAKNMPGGSIDNRIARSAYLQRTLYNAKRGL